MRIAAFRKPFPVIVRQGIPALLAVLLSLTVWTGPAEAAFTCSSNADCSDTATGCNDGHCGVKCATGICRPSDPDADNIGCIVVPDDSKCDDGQLCNGPETCSLAKGCEAGVPPTCDDQIPCTLDSCDANANQCKHTGRDNMCSNGGFCDGVEICDSNQGCIPGPTPACDDGFACTLDFCDSSTDSCRHSTNNAACNNGQYCDGVETCSAAKGCQAGTPPNCSDGVSCTADACNETTDSCTHTANNNSCSNGLFCDGPEVCSPTKGCQPGTPPNCSDNVDCTLDRCLESNDTCDHVTRDTYCNDNRYCDGVEVCNLTLGCQEGAPINCDDGVTCTVDTCNEFTDSCAHGTNSALCSNGLFCDGKEVCDELIGCHRGLAPDCDDDVGCTTDACVEETDSCSHSASNAACDDGLFCDGAENCHPTLGCQNGTAPECEDDIECTVDSCSEASKSCVNAADNAFCSDGLFCDGSEICNPAMGCQSGTPPNCTDSLTCTTDSCFEPGDKCLFTPNFSLCGNGVVDPGCGEECDEDNGEICNNDIDDDGDMLIDCADPHCAEETEPTCDETCQLVPPCRLLLRDPALISYDASSDRAVDKPGLFYFHARLIPTTPINPAAERFIVTLANANGVIYRAQVMPVDVRANGRRYIYRAPNPEAAARDGGILRLSVVRRTYEQGEVGYGFRVRAYGDFSAATLAKMTTQVYFGDDVGYVTAEWSGEPGRWVLRWRDYDPSRQ